MNLNQLLNYRRICPICQTELVSETNFIFSKGEIKICYILNNKKTVSSANEVMPMFGVYKCCPSCFPPFKNRIYFPNIENMLIKNYYSYSFVWNKFGDFRFSNEVFKFYKDKQYYHILNDIDNNALSMYCYNKKQKLQNVSMFNTVAANFKNINNVEDLLNKYKLYTVFS